MKKRRAFITEIKVIVSGQMVEVYQAKTPVFAIGLEKKGKETGGPIAPLSQEERERQDKNNALRSYFEFERRAVLNFKPNKSCFLTLTFRDTENFDVTDVATCNACFKGFIRKLRKKYGKAFKYVATIEFQDSNKRGAVHYHMLISLSYLKCEDVQKLWGHGAINIQKMKNTRHAVSYVAKYMKKGLIDDRLRGKKKWHGSMNLFNPIERYGDAAKDVLNRIEALPEGQKEKYSENHYFSEYSKEEISYTRYFIQDEELISYLDYNMGQSS